MSASGRVRQASGLRSCSLPPSSSFSGSSVSQPYRFGGRVGLFGHYLRSLSIILLLTCIKLDTAPPYPKNSVNNLLKSICHLASSLEAVERKYVKRGQRLLFCGPDLCALGALCLNLQRDFDAHTGESK